MRYTIKSFKGNLAPQKGTAGKAQKHYVKAMSGALSALEDLEKAAKAQRNWSKSAYGGTRPWQD